MKTLFLTMTINAELKALLQELANAENRTLTNFIETELQKIAAAPKRKHKSAMPARGARAARLTMRISVALKAKLQELANEQYPTLTDFIENELRRIVAARRTKAQKIERR